MYQNHVYIGIDWADEEHAFHLFADQQEDHGSFKQDPQAIEQTIQSWRKNYPHAKLLIAIEQAKGALINALIGYDDLQIFPVNPTALANYRKAFAHGGGKNDPNDAKLLGQFLQHYHQQLRPLRHDEPVTRELATLCEDRRRFVDQVILRTHSRRVIAICEMIHALNTTIDRYDDQLKQLVCEHTDYAIVASLPNASVNTQSRMIAALGDDRTRYPDAHSLQCAAGIAPITKQSGKQKTVCARWACTKFMKQTFHEYAGLSIKKSRWAKAYYLHQIENGKTPQMAKRALAFKWIRIIRRCWEDRAPYDEQRYIQRLKETGSPIAKLIEAN